MEERDQTPAEQHDEGDVNDQQQPALDDGDGQQAEQGSGDEQSEEA